MAVQSDSTHVTERTLPRLQIVLGTRTLVPSVSMWMDLVIVVSFDSFR